MKYQPSGRFLMIVVPSATLAIALGVFLKSEKQSLEGKPASAKGTPAPSTFITGGMVVGQWPAFADLEETLRVRWEDVMTWERNPWKRPRKDSFGSHYLEMSGSTDPMQCARAEELRRLAAVWLAKVVRKYPELGTVRREVPDERNGFLQLLEFAERDGVLPPMSRRPSPLDCPESLEGDEWDRAEARNWVATNQSLIDEVRAIGLLPDHSTTGISLQRFHYVPAREIKNGCDALLVEARLRAEDGDTAGALESVRAARGIASHLTEVETPTLLTGTIGILIQMGLQSAVIERILPAVPPEAMDVDEWESTVRPVVEGPSGLAHLMRGEWEVTSNYWLTPMLCDPDEPRPPIDPDALVEAHAEYFHGIVTACHSSNPKDLANLTDPPLPDTSKLSRRSREFMDIEFVGANSWRKGWERAQSVSGRTRAVFQILRGEPVPKDPVYGLPYRWDPATRTLSVPDDPAFAEMRIEPIVVPRK